MARYAYTTVAQAYGSNNYGSCDYNCATTSGSTGSSTGAGGSNPLANTGVAIVGVVTLACLIIFIALLVRFVGRRKHDKISVVQGRDSADDASGNENK